MKRTGYSRLLFRFILWMTAPMMAWGQAAPPNCRLGSDPHTAGCPAPDFAKDLDQCRIREARTLPGSHRFGSDFIEAMAVDPSLGAKDPNAVWALTADLSSKVPSEDHAMYISKSANGGKTWTQVARVDSRYFDEDIAEGERNGLGVFPGGTEFVITTQRGAFQVLPQSGPSDPVVKPIAGPRVPPPDPEVSLPKREGDPVTAGVVKITADGKHMIVGYGYFDLHPQILTYRRGGNGSWIEDRRLPHLPTQMDILSMQFGDPGSAGASSLCGDGRSSLPPEGPRHEMDSHRRSGCGFGGAGNKHSGRSSSGRLLGCLQPDQCG